MTSSPPDLLSLAQELLTRGLAGSAARLLEAHQGRGFKVNNLRSRAARLPDVLRPGIYFACTWSGIGLLVPAQARRGDHLAADARVGEALTLALALARNELHCRAHESLPRLSLDLENLPVEGASLGLAAALAFCGEYAGRPPLRAVVALGELAGDGTVLRVDHLEAKLEAVRSLAPGALVLMQPGDLALASALAPETRIDTRPVVDLPEAVRAAFGEKPLVVLPSLLTLEDCLLEADAIKDHVKALRYLDAISGTALADADQARVLCARGTRLRHLGRWSEALVVHRRASELARAQRGVLGTDRVEVIETELLATLMDTFEIESVVERLRARMQSAGTAHNAVRFRGMLAQALSFLGQEQGLLLREQSLSEQGASAEMRAELPRTLCYLVYESARVGDHGRFERYARDLWSTTGPGEEFQQRYNDCAFLRGMVLLGQAAEAVAWLEGERMHGIPSSPLASALLAEDAAIADYPEVTTARAAVRALRRRARSEEAARLAARVDPSRAKGNLLEWLALLCRAEGRLARGVGPGEPDAELAELASRLEELHPAAARFHRGLLEALRGPIDPAALEAEIDRVYY